MTYARPAKASQIGYKRGRKSSTVDSRPPTEAFRAGADRMGWATKLVFCAGCGCQPRWCECGRAQPGEQQEQHG